MVKTSQTTGIPGLVSKYNIGSLNGWLLYLNNGIVQAFYFKNSANYVYEGGTGAFNGGNVADGNWHHVALTIDASGGKIYVDGVLKDTQAWNGAPGATTTAQPLQIGSFAGGSALTGQIDETRIWNISRPAADIAADVNASLQGSEAGLLAYYRLDEHSNTLSDATGHGYTGTFLNSDINANWTASGSPINTVHALPGIPSKVTLAGYDLIALPLTFSITANPTKGAFSGATQTFTCTPNGTYAGTDSFQYRTADALRSGTAATVNINYGPSASLSGTAALDSIVPAALAQTITFQFTPADGTLAFTRTANITTAGTFSLPLLPKRSYSVQVKGFKRLAVVASADLTGGSVSGFNAALAGGDANNDNTVDIGDFGILVNVYGSSYDVNSVFLPDPKAEADFNCDGTVNIADFGILVNNYGSSGQ